MPITVTGPRHGWHVMRQDLARIHWSSTIPQRVFSCSGSQGIGGGGRSSIWYMEEVEIRLMRETSSRVLALLKGDIHTADTNFPPDQLEKLEKSPRLKVTAHNSMAPCYIKMHNLREPFTDIHV